MAFGRLFTILTLVGIITTISGCGGGGGSGGANGFGPNPEPEVFTTTPSQGAFVSAGSDLEFIVTNTETANTTLETYSFTLYADEALLAEIVSVSDLTEDESGVVKWIADAKSGEDRSYWWQYAVTYTNAAGAVLSETSEPLQVRTKRNDALEAASPRTGGYLDSRHITAPQLAVRNYYTGGDVVVSYDFELFADGAATQMLSAIYGLAQQTTEMYTVWHLPVAEVVEAPIETPAEVARSSMAELAEVTLVEGTTYYWRVREVIDGIPGNFAQIFSFTVTDTCSISNSNYAEHVFEWTRVRQCDEIGFTDTNQALGSPNAGGNVGSYHGFVSIDIQGTLGVEMGRTIYNGPGNDIRVYEYVAWELLELFAAQSEIGPWYSLGARGCDPYCDWDLGASPLTYARYFRVHDNWPLPESCHSTSGGDIDSVQALNWVTDPANQCAQ